MNAGSGNMPNVETVSCDGARAFRHTSACTAEQAAELTAIARRPPPGMVLYKFGSRSVVGRHVLTDGTAVVLKYYYPKSPLKHVTQALTGSRCMRSWQSALDLERLGLPVPPALIVAEWRALGGLWLVQSMLATAVAPGIPLPDWVERHQHDAGRLAAMAARLRGHFALMAKHRAAHGDLKATNLIVADDDSVRFVDLDAVSVRLAGSAWPAARARDRRIFLANWQPGSAAASAFKDVFEPDPMP
jgi:tRNA A-37 threonylcarbamoyl transferase component Bud32